MKTNYDYIIIGSGFGGSVSALRLAEKGYKVAVVEKGRRYRTQDFPKSNWNLKKFLWIPQLHLYGIQALTLLKDVFILHGTGVGGGSLVYANNLLIPPDEVFDNQDWGIPHTKETLTQHYHAAARMLGAVPSKVTVKADEFLKSAAKEIHKEDSFHVNDVGIYFGEPDVTVPDPYFNGNGPTRTGCNLCGGCMTGCRVGAKNTLDKNYLHLAESLGVEVIPETEVLDVQIDSSGNYILKTRKSTGILRTGGTLTSSGVVFSGGVMGTVKLLLKCKAAGSLPALSTQLGNFVRTNSEALVGIKTRGGGEDYSRGIAITSGIYPDEQTHIETVRYGAGHDAMAAFATIMVDGSDKIPRPLLFLIEIVKHPVKFIKSFGFLNWARRTTILLVMQTIPNYLRLDYHRRWWRLGRRSLNSNWNTGEKVPSYIPIANQIARSMAEKMDGEPLSVLPEVLFNTSSTAHILGGCMISDDADGGVIDSNGRVHGYENMFVVDGSTVPANLGVNPSLTISALAEYFMSKIPDKDRSGMKPGD